MREETRRIGQDCFYKVCVIFLDYFSMFPKEGVEGAL